MPLVLSDICSCSRLSWADRVAVSACAPRFSGAGVHALLFGDVQRTGLTWSHLLGVHVVAGPSYDEGDEIITAAVVGSRIVGLDVSSVRERQRNALDVHGHGHVFACSDDTQSLTGGRPKSFGGDERSADP